MCRTDRKLQGGDRVNDWPPQLDFTVNIVGSISNYPPLVPVQLLHYAP